MLRKVRKQQPERPKLGLKKVSLIRKGRHFCGGGFLAVSPVQIARI
jgi:hypothetical protein